MTPIPETVVLVHGLWVRGLVMEWLRRRLAQAGFSVVSYSYPSMRLSLTENAERLARYCRDRSPARMHFLGHSLGGLIVLRMFERGGSVPDGRIVLAGMPFGGSLAAQRLLRVPGGRAALGRSIAEWLRAGPPLPPADREIGVIAGNLPVGLGRVVAPDLPPPNDGVLSVAETVVPGVRDRIVLKVSHSSMLLSAAVAQQTCAFLQHGVFAHPK